jgi:hypothetical protein
MYISGAKEVNCLTSIQNDITNFKHIKLQHFCNPFIIVYCYTSCTRQSIVEREGLEHDERSEEWLKERVRQHVL